MFKKVLWIIGVLFAINILINAFPAIIGILVIASILYVAYKIAMVVYRTNRRNQYRMSNSSSEFERWRNG